MKITANDAVARQVLRSIEANYRADEKVPDGKWHVYDLLFPRKTYGCEVYGCKPTREDIGFFFFGKAVHREIQRVLGIERAEIQGERFGVVGTMDYKGERAFEIKSSRKWTVPKYPEGHYVRQAGYYAVVHNLDVLDILVIYPTAGRTWKGTKSSTVEAMDWTVQFTAADKKTIEYDLKRTIEEIEWAIKKRNPSKLPPAPKWTVERFGASKVPAGKYDFDFAAKHPFPYAYEELGKL